MNFSFLMDCVIFASALAQKLLRIVPLESGGSWSIGEADPIVLSERENHVPFRGLREISGRMLEEYS